MGPLFVAGMNHRSAPVEMREQLALDDDKLRELLSTHRELAAKLAERCEVQFAYAIGHPDPVSVHIETFGTAAVNTARIVKAVNRVFSFQPADIIDQLNLRRPIYSQTTNYGHFGKSDKDLTWEATDKVAALQKAVR